MSENTNTAMNETIDVAHENKFLPRLIGVVSGALGGFSIAKKLRGLSLRHYVDGQLKVNNEAVVRTRDEILGKLANENGVFNKADFVLGARSAANNAIDQILQKRNESLEKILQENAPAAVAAAKKVKDASSLEMLRAEQTLFEKPLFDEIIKRLDMGMKQSEHKAAIYSFAVASTVAIGFVAYNVAKKIFNNPHPETHQERTKDSRMEAMHAASLGG